MPAFKEKTLARVENALQELRELAKEEIPREVVARVEAFAELVEQEGRRNLSRPSWLLSRSFGAKVKEYEDGGKVFAVVGFQFRSKDKRDPGFYGKYHEGGWAPPGRKPTAPPRFIRRAKIKYLPLLEQSLQELQELLPK